MSVTFFGHFLKALQKKKEKTYFYFMQDGVTELCAYSINVLTEVFEDRPISCKLWLARFPDLSDSYL
jgi:hypothetical protein